MMRSGFIPSLLRWSFMRTSFPLLMSLGLLVALSLASDRNASEEKPQEATKEPIEPVRRDAPFHAYWIAGTSKEREAGYERLLITHGPLESLAGHEQWSPFPLDNMAMTFRTYRRDSFWDQPFRIVKKIGVVDRVARTVMIDGEISNYDPCELEDVVGLLERPQGTKPLHRIVAPLQFAEQTARAFRLLLKEQLQQAPAKPNGI